MLIISLYLEMVVIVLAFIFLANYSANNLSPVSTDISVVAVTLYLIVFIYSFIYLFQQNLHKNQEIDSMAEEKQKYEVGSFVVRANRENRKLNYEEVVYIESLADYVKIHITGGETVLTKEKISKLAELLPDQFLRIHRSFIVNKHAISAFNKDSISINNQQLSISRSYKDAVISQLQGLQ
jgi:DNA-binding LytR/AlgR family response regulator